MTKFVYKFDSIKKLKETLEKKVRKEISVLEKSIEGMNAKFHEKLIEIENNKRSFSEQKSIKASELRFRNDVEYLLELDLMNIKSEISRLEQLKKIKFDELLEKSKESKMFETLQDKFQEDFIITQNHLEQKEIDEMAVNKYIREES